MEGGLVNAGAGHPSAVGAPEVHFRPSRGEPDYAAFAELATLTSSEDFEFIWTTEFIRRYFTDDLERFDVVTSVLVAEANGQMVGFGYGHWDRDRDDAGRILWTRCRVHPAWRRRGIGRRLLTSAQAAAIRHASTRPPSDLQPVFLTVAGESAVGSIALLAGDGYGPVRWTNKMVRATLDDPPDATLPAGIEARPVRPNDALAVLRAMNEAMRDEWNTREVSEASMASSLADPVEGQIDLWQVAWDGNEVVGGVLGFIDDEENRSSGRRRGYTERIFTRRPWRGRGIATALIGRNLRELARRGMTEAALMVDAANPSGALGVYERAGFRPVRTITTYGRAVRPSELSAR